MFSLLVEYRLMHRADCINCETCYFGGDVGLHVLGCRVDIHVISVLIRLLYGRVLGAQTFTLLSL